MSVPLLISAILDEIISEKIIPSKEVWVNEYQEIRSGSPGSRVLDPCLVHNNLPKRNKTSFEK